MTRNVLRVARALFDVPDRRRFGFELKKITRLSNASMYKALHRMANAGWLESHMEQVPPPPAAHPARRLRRYYVLTPEGEQFLAAELETEGSFLLYGDAA